MDYLPRLVFTLDDFWMNLVGQPFTSVLLWVNDDLGGWAVHLGEIGHPVGVAVERRCCSHVVGPSIVGRMHRPRWGGSALSLTYTTRSSPTSMRTMAIGQYGCFFGLPGFVPFFVFLPAMSASSFPAEARLRHGDGHGLLSGLHHRATRRAGMQRAFLELRHDRVDLAAFPGHPSRTVILHDPAQHRDH